MEQVGCGLEEGCGLVLNVIRRGWGSGWIGWGVLWFCGGLICVEVLYLILPKASIRSNCNGLYAYAIEVVLGTKQLLCPT